MFPRSELKKAMADETAAKEAVNTALTAVQDEYAELEQAAVAVCQELEGEGALSGSSVASRLRALGDRVAERAKSTFRHGESPLDAEAEGALGMLGDSIAPRSQAAGHRAT